MSTFEKQRLGQQIGNYRLVDWLGKGGFADVYLGEHIYLKTQGAIKILRLQLSDDFLQDFLTEAQTIARLDHPNIVRVLDYGVQEETPFLVMSYAPNGSLRKRYSRRTRLPLAQIVSILQQMASALDYAHQLKLIHRDVKPENMLIGPQFQVLLSDFGLALAATSSASQAVTNTAGTVPYMAPEQLQGRVRYASDQYALGVVAYEWISGERPFTGSFTEIASQHVLVPPPSLCNQVPDLPPAVEQVVFKAMAKDPGQRFETATAFAQALRQACNLPEQSSSLLSFLPTQPITPSQATLVINTPAPTTQSDYHTVQMADSTSSPTSRPNTVSGPTVPFTPPTNLLAGTRSTPFTEAPPPFQPPSPPLYTPYAYKYEHKRHRKPRHLSRRLLLVLIVLFVVLFTGGGMGAMHYRLPYLQLLPTGRERSSQQSKSGPPQNTVPGPANSGVVIPADTPTANTGPALGPAPTPIAAYPTPLPQTATPMPDCLKATPII